MPSDNVTVELTSEEYERLVEAFHNHRQEHFLDKEIEKRVREEHGVETIKRFEFPMHCRDAIVQQYLKNNGRFGDLLNALQQQGLDFDGTNWYLCECGETSLPSPPGEKPECCENCGAEIPTSDGLVNDPRESDD